MIKKVRIRNSGVVSNYYFKLQKAVVNIGSYNSTDNEIFAYIFREAEKKEKKENKNFLENSKDFFIKNWRYFISFLLPPIFYGFCLLGGEIEGALATSTAVILAGCVSMIVLQENKRIEDLKLDEKWIYEIRELLSEYSFLVSGVLSKISDGCREIVGFDLYRIKDNEDERLKLIKPLGLDKLQEHILNIAKSEEFDEAERTYRKLELMLESHERSDLAVNKLKMFEMSISHAGHLILRRSQKEAILSVKSLSVLAMKGTEEVCRDIRVFLDHELARSKRGSVEVRRNIRALYYGIISVLFSYIGYIAIKYIFITGGGNGQDRVFVLWLIPNF